MLTWLLQQAGVIEWVLALITAYVVIKKVFFGGKMMAQRDIKGSILITGCDYGMGAATAKRLGEMGHRVFAGIINPKSAEQFKTTGITPIVMDVTKSEDVKRVIEEIEQAGPLWAVVNNAGILIGAYLEISDIDDFEKTMAVNVIGVARVIKATMPLLKKTKGRVVNMCSIGGNFPIFGAVPYTTSKFAIVGMSECIRPMLAFYGIDLVVIKPGAVRTTMGHVYIENVEKRCERAPEEIKAVYNEGFLERFKYQTNNTYDKGAIEADEVVEQIVRAVLLDKPPAEIWVGRAWYWWLNSIAANMFKTPAKLYVRYILSGEEPSWAVKNMLFW